MGEKTALTAEAAEHAAEMARYLGMLTAAIDHGDAAGARDALKALKRSAEALQFVLTTGLTMKQP